MILDWNTALLGLLVVLLGWIKLDCYHLVKRIDGHIQSHGGAGAADLNHEASR